MRCCSFPMALLAIRAKETFWVVVMSSSLCPTPVLLHPCCIPAAPLPPAGRQPGNGRGNGTPLLGHILGTPQQPSPESVGGSSWVWQEGQERASPILTMAEINRGAVLRISKGSFREAHNWAHLSSVLQSEQCRNSWSYLSPDGEKNLSKSIFKGLSRCCAQIFPYKNYLLNTRPLIRIERLNAYSRYSFVLCGLFKLLLFNLPKIKLCSNSSVLKFFKWP